MTFRVHSLENCSNKETLAWYILSLLWPLFSIPTKCSQLSLGGKKHGVISVVIEIHTLVKTIACSHLTETHMTDPQTSSALQIEGLLLYAKGSRSKSTKKNKREKEAPKRMTDAHEFILPFETSYHSNHSAQIGQQTDCYCFTD